MQIYNIIYAIMIYGRVYKIYCNETCECYYGSTELTIEQRLSNHIKDYKKWKKGKSRYVTAYRIIERGNYKILLMEEGEFEETYFMEKRERHYIENFECVNNNIPTRTQKEYYEANRQRLLEDMREYQQANKAKIAEQKREYREANREQIAEYFKKYREAKYTCECGSVISRADKSTHLKTKKHQNYIKNIIASVVEDIRIHIKQHTKEQINTKTI